MSGFLDRIELADFRDCVEVETRARDYPGAIAVERNIPVYDAQTVDDSIMPEWVRLFESGPGVMVLKRGFGDLAAIDEATEVFRAIIAEERTAGLAAGDHFAKAGANDRVWNAHQKLCLRAPETFLRYTCNPAVDTLYRAWLGPGYQMATQINQVRPTGKAQSPHRDYHLGFMSEEQVRLFPEPLHRNAHLFIMQGGVAHVDIPVEAGPTKLLPYSQRYPQGFAAYPRPDFVAYFEANQVQLPLEKGDCVFFSPALFHAGGENRTSDIERMVNLLQVSSPFVRAMESLDRAAMVRAVYPYLAGLDADALRLAVAVTAEGYPFPTNLDTDPPLGGLAPESQQAMVLRAVAESWDADRVARELDAQEAKRRA